MTHAHLLLALLLPTKRKVFGGSVHFLSKWPCPNPEAKGVSLFGVSVHFISKWHYLNPEAK